MFSTCTTATNYRFLFFLKKIFIFLRFYNFIGYPMKSKGYRFYCPNHSTKIIKTDNARFIENGEISGSDQLQETNIQEVGVQVPLPITFKEIAAPTIVESFDNVEQQINDQSLPNEITTNEPIMEETQQSTLKRSQRERKLAISNDYVLYLHESDYDIETSKDPVSFSQAISCNDYDKWIDAMNNELKSMDQTKVWELVEFTERYKVVVCKWVFKTKSVKPGNIRNFQKWKNDNNNNNKLPEWFREAYKIL